jgi:hypothetical protein
MCAPLLRSFYTPMCLWLTFSATNRRSSYISTVSLRPHALHANCGAARISASSIQINVYVGGGLGRRRASTAQGAHGPIGSSCDRDVERFSFVCTVGRSCGKLELVSLMGVLRPGTGKLQSGSAGLDLRKATCGPVPTHHKPYKVAGPRLSRRIYPPTANQMTSPTATMARPRPPG